MTSAANATPGALSGVDVLVVVDDWKGSAGDRGFSPTYFAGRTFLARDPRSSDIIRLLDDVGAAAWHASGSRKTHHFLFDEARFTQILDFLNFGETAIYDQLGSTAAYSRPPILAKWREILDRDPALRAVWDVGNPHAMALFRFTDFLRGYLADNLSGDLRVRVVVDSLDWMSSRTHLLASKADGVGVLRSTPRFELLTILDPSGVGAARYLPLLGLVDSEVWAFGRFNCLKLPDGRTVRERYLEWRARGAPADVTPVSEDEFAAAIGLTHGGHANVQAYWDAMATWTGTRSITLTEARRRDTAV